MLNVLLPAFFVGLLLSLLAAPLGSLMLWRRLSFFSDSLAHAAMLGVAIASLGHFQNWLGALLSALLVSASVWYFYDRRLPSDAVLAFMSASLLCLAVILVSVNTGINSQLLSLLLGDILLMSTHDLLWLVPIVCIGCIVIWTQWQAQLNCALDEEVAASNRIRTKLQLAIFMGLMCVFCVTGLKAVGSLLISGLLVIPALVARLFAKTPIQMVLLAWLVNILSLILGLAASAYWNIPTSPTIVAVMSIVFIICYVANRAFVNHYGSSN